MTIASSGENSIGFGKLLRGAAQGLCFSLCCAIALLLLFSLVCYMMPDPDQHLTLFGLAALYLSALIGGIAAGRKSGIIGGLLSGVLLCAVILLASSFKGNEPAQLSLGITVLLYVLVPAAGTMGGFLSGIRRKSAKRKGPRGAGRKKRT